MTNRSVPVSTLLPHLVYRDVSGAIEYLSKTFGFVERRGCGCADNLGEVYVMLSSSREGRESPVNLGGWTQSLYEAAKAAGAKIVEDLHETIYGERQYGAEDHEGHLWLFSRHARDVDPAEWGAR